MSTAVTAVINGAKNAGDILDRVFSRVSMVMGGLKYQLVKSLHNSRGAPYSVYYPGASCDSHDIFAENLCCLKLSKKVIFFLFTLPAPTSLDREYNGLVCGDVVY
jgi:hypothetical protein